MGDKILSPGPPEVEAMARYRCAQLSNFTELSPPGAGPKPVINPHDCALAVMSDAGIKVANVVPNPNDPRRLVALKGCHSESELKALVRATARVFMLGSSSGFSRGQLVDENSGTVGLKVRTGELYYYKSCHVIEGGNAKIGFSQPGDSGALVYSEDLKAVGFVVGAKNMEDGKGLRTFIYNAAAVLRLLDVRLPP